MEDHIIITKIGSRSTAEFERLVALNQCVMEPSNFEAVWSVGFSIQVKELT